jgi:hypothetical protein
MSRSLVHATRQTPACEEAHFVPGSCDSILTGAVSDRAPGTSWDPVQPWAARAGGGVTVAIPQLQGGEQGVGNRDALGCIAIDGAGMRIGSHDSASPPRGRIILETDSHDPGDRFASTWRHSHEPGTHKMAVILAIESHDPGTVTILSFMRLAKFDAR